MEKIYRDGLAEVDIILNYADEESLNKIPKSLKDFIKENKSDYISNINPEKDLQEQNLLYETKVILSVLYRDYWASEDERKQLIEEDKIELEKQESMKQTIYSYDNLFRHNKITENSEEIKSIVVKETILKKILNRIKRFLKIGVNS